MAKAKKKAAKKKAKKISKRKSQPAPDYAALTTTDAKQAAIEEAEKVADLNVMWATWEERGLSREGLLYAMVLMRKQELGQKLSEEEQGIIGLAVQRQQDGANLPPIVGRMRGGKVLLGEAEKPPSTGTPTLTTGTS